MKVIFEIIICVLAGAGAGIGTGFAGLSAAVFISPMLVAFLDAPVYSAVGIALASDVLASAVSAYTYHKEGNIDLKKGRPLLITVVGFAIVGSLIAFLITSSDTGDTVLGYWSIVASLLLGISFLFKKDKKKERKQMGTGRFLATLASGTYIGLICGFQGTGGGMMMLIVLTMIMQFEYKTAVGTSVFIMTFTAFIGAVVHFTMKGMPDLTMLVLCVLSTLIFAKLAASMANHMEEHVLNRVIGMLLTVSGLIMLATQIFL